MEGQRRDEKIKLKKGGEGRVKDRGDEVVKEGGGRKGI